MNGDGDEEGRVGDGVRPRGPIGNIHRGNMKTVLKPYLEVFIF